MSTEDLTKSVDPPGGPLLLLTKLHPPPERDQAIVRERLMERLQPTPAIKLTVVAAPPGFCRHVGPAIRHHEPSQGC